MKKISNYIDGKSKEYSSQEYSSVFDPSTGEEINKVNLTYPGTWGKRNPPRNETSNSGEDQFWITHRNKIPKNEENSDIATLSRGEVSISPIGPRFLVNDYDQSLKEWINSFN